MRLPRAPNGAISILRGCDMRIESPCKDCPDRYLGCHDRCEKYQAFKKDKNNYKEELAKTKEKYAYFIKRAKEDVEKRRRK